VHGCQINKYFYFLTCKKADFFKNQKRSKKPIKSTCDTYLRVIQEEQKQKPALTGEKHLGIANKVRISKSKA